MKTQFRTSRLWLKGRFFFYLKSKSYSVKINKKSIKFGAIIFLLDEWDHSVASTLFLVLSRCL